LDLKEILRKRAKLVADARAIEDAASAENRAKSPEERTRFDALLSEAEGLGEQISQRQRLDALSGVIASGGTERNGDPLPHQTEKRHQYSILKAIRQIADKERVDGLEGEVSQELVKRRGKPVRGNGFVMPYDLPIDLRSAAMGGHRFGNAEQRVGVLNTTTGTGGIPTVLDTTYIDLLRNRLVTRQAGATVMVDMQGLFSIPRQNQAGTMQWVAESGSPSTSNQTIDQVSFSPKTAAAYTDISRRLAEQINTDAEMFVRADLAAIVARGVDLAGLSGSGSSNQPTGVANTSGIGSVALGTNGLAPTWDMIVALETAVATANADMGALGYIANAKTRGKMKVTAKIGSTFPIYLWNSDSPDTPLNGYRALVSNQVRSTLTKGSSSGVCSELFFGNWSDLIMAFWSGMDVIVDPYTGSTSGTVRIVTLQDMDINVRHPESFAVCSDILTT
jgi:HK97 family phage major capsid protein